MSAPNLMTLTKRTSLNVYGADIFTCSRQANQRSGPLPQSWPSRLAISGLPDAEVGA